MPSGDSPPNTSGLPDPDRIHTREEFSEALRLLRGTSSYAQLDAAARRTRPGGSEVKLLPAATLSDLLNGKSLPTRETLSLFLEACDLVAGAQQPWLAAWERVSTAHLHKPLHAVRVRDARPRLLGVHASIQMDPGVDTLPTYVPRDLDLLLREAVAAAAGDGGFVLLRGGSSVGKTRTLFEAVRATLPEWWLLHPADMSAVRALAEKPAPRTVLWLDELQRYLDQPGGLPVGTVRSLVGTGMVIVATLWPNEYNARVLPRTPEQDDPYANDREVINLARIFDVGDEFTAAELSRAEDLASDERIRAALTSKDAGLTQVLAAGPELIRWWENADPGDPRQSCGKAIVTAALDARRMGVRAPLTREFLAAAAPGYLTSAQQAAAPPDWLDQAVSYATAKLHGAASCLTPVAGGMGVVRGYHTADYLHQHALVARRTAPLPDAVWTALVDHHDPEDTNRLADSADRRAQHRHATALYRRLADRDAPGAALTLATHLQLRGNVTELRERADAGDVAASSRLAELLRDRGGRDELRQRADAGDQYAGRALAELLTSEEKLDEAAALLRRLAESGDPQTNRRLAGVLACQGHIDEAIGHLRARAEEKDQTAARQLAVLLFRQGRGDEAVALLQQPAHAEDSLNKMQLARILVRLGRIGELQERAADGDPEAVALWAEDLIRKGQTVEATALVEQHVHLSSGRPRRGPLTALLAKLLAQQGRSDELRQRSAAGDRHAADALARLLAENGDAGGLRALADSGNSAASTRYADLLERTGRADEAIAMLRRRLDSGDRKPARRLIALLERQGCVDEALTILRRLSDSGDSRSSALLLNMLVKHARFDEIELEARAGTFAADVYWNFWKDHRKFGARMSEFQESWLQRFDRPTAGPSPARTAGQREVFSVNLIDGTIQQLI